MRHKCNEMKHRKLTFYHKASLDFYSSPLWICFKSWYFPPRSRSAGASLVESHLGGVPSPKAWGLPKSCTSPYTMAKLFQKSSSNVWSHHVKYIKKQTNVCAICLVQNVIGWWKIVCKTKNIWMSKSHIYLHLFHFRELGQNYKKIGSYENFKIFFRDLLTFSK